MSPETQRDSFSTKHSRGTSKDEDRTRHFVRYRTGREEEDDADDEEEGGLEGNQDIDKQRTNDN